MSNKRHINPPFSQNVNVLTPMFQNLLGLIKNIS